MKIAIDISPIVYGTGVSVYTKELVTNLLEIDGENEYVLYGGSLRRKQEIRDFLDTLQGESLHGRVFPIAPTLADTIWNRLHILPVERLVGKVDVFHSSDWTQPPSKAYKVTTIHDLVPILYPEWSDPKIVCTHKRRLKWVKREVDAIIVPSKQTKMDLMEMGFVGKKIKVIAEAANSEVKRASKTEIKAVKEKCGFDGKYLLSVGITPRKNTQRIIEAYRLLKKDTKFNSYKLVLIGHPYMGLNSTEGVVITGHVPDEDLYALYSGAEVMLFPSLYEGFGIPILDSMKVSVPVVTSNTGSTREVAGDAAVLVDAESEEEIAIGIRKAMKNRKSLVQKGKTRVKQFSWQQMARETLSVYKEYE